MTKFKTFLSGEGEPSRKKSSIYILVIVTVLSTLLAISIQKAQQQTAQAGRMADLIYKVIDASNTAVIVVDKQGRITTVNASMVELTQWSEEELEGKPLQDIIPLRYQAQHTSAYSNRVTTVIKSKQNFETILKCSIARKDGTEIPVLVRVHVTPDNLSMAFITREENITIRSADDHIHHDGTITLEALWEKVDLIEKKIDALVK